MPPPAAAASSQAQYASQFLSTALSQRGPNALPYTEDTKWLIRHHLVSLVEAFPSLTPKASLFTHNDGRAAHLLQAEGTVPIVYSGAVYNIPAVIWLLETYPRSPPSVFLTPTRDMIVKPGHPFVDRNGHVMVPYLRSWVYPSSNLVDLVRSMSQIFGQDPPLFTRQPSASATTNPNPSPSPPTPEPTPPPNSHSLSSSYSRPSPSHSFSSSSSTYPASPYAIRPSPQHHHQDHRPMDDPAEVFRRNAINAILEKVRSDKAALQSRLDGELEGLFATQAELRRRDETLSVGLRQMVDEKETLEQQLQLILMNTDILEGWVRENEGKMKARWSEGTGPEDAFEPCDGLSRQLLDCTAADLAVEDTIYALDKAAQEGSIPFTAYLKNTRALARDQFFQRATALKVRAAQVQAHVTSMAARAPPQYVV